MSNEKNYAIFRNQLLGLLGDLDESAKRVVSDMANVGLAVTKKNTPVSGYETSINSKGVKVYRKKKGAVVGGTLRKAWLKNKTFKVAGTFQSGYSNNTAYGIYVNNGHRITTPGEEGRVTVGYVKGVRMLEQGMNEARRQTQSLFQKEITRVKRKSGF